MNARIESLGLVHSACWRELERAARERDHGWRCMALASRDGDEVDVRNIVLRAVDAELARFVFYTDARSPKVAQFARHPDVALVGWSPSLGWQLRIKARLTVETSGLALSSRWAQLKLTPARFDYLSPLPPGTPLEGATPERSSREHFAMVTGQVLCMDWLELHPDGNRRARFDAQGQQWLVP